MSATHKSNAFPHDAGPSFYFVIGFAAGASIAGILTIALLLLSEIGAGRALHDWQTLIAGVLAVLAAITSVYFLAQQTNMTRALWEENIERERFAVMATLPATIEPLYEYASSCLAVLHAMEARFHDDGYLEWTRENAPPRKPTIPEVSLGALKDAIKYCAKENRSAILWIAHRAQIVDARMDSFYMLEQNSFEVSTVIGVENWLVQATDMLEFRARVGKLFTYARENRIIIDQSISFDELNATRMLLGLDWRNERGLTAKLQERASSPTPVAHSI